MPRIRCTYIGCVYQENGACRAEEIDLDVEDGCLAFTPIDDLPLENDDWGDLVDDQDSYYDDDDAYDPREWNQQSPPGSF